MKKLIINGFVIFVFAAFLFFFAVMNLITPDKAFSESENRYLAKRPEFSFKSLISGEYTKKIDEYVTDQFIFRDDFIKLKNISERIVGKMESNGVYFAKDGYLIEKHEEKSIDRALLERNISRLSKFVSENSKKLGKEHISIMIVPTASNILSDKLPIYASQFDQDGMLEGIKAAVSDGTFVDVQQALKKQCDRYIYYKTDHHWTTEGAFYAYRAFCDAVEVEGKQQNELDAVVVSDDFYGTVYTKAKLPSTKPDKMYRYDAKLPAEFTVEYDMNGKIKNTMYEDSYLSKRDKYSYYLNGNNALVKISNKSIKASNRKLLIVKDSFAHSFAPIAANDFAELHMIDLRYYNASTAEYIEENDITDVLVLYNTINFADETTLVKLNS